MHNTHTHTNTQTHNAHIRRTIPPFHAAAAQVGVNGDVLAVGGLFSYFTGTDGIPSAWDEAKARASPDVYLFNVSKAHAAHPKCAAAGPGPGPANPRPADAIAFLPAGLPLWRRGRRAAGALKSGGAQHAAQSGQLTARHLGPDEPDPAGPLPPRAAPRCAAPRRYVDSAFGVKGAVTDR
jgi:hypothetical protein